MQLEQWTRFSAAAVLAKGDLRERQLTGNLQQVRGGCSSTQCFLFRLRAIWIAYSQ
jgi:hypothetical protein